MPLTRQQVFDIVNTEREYQDGKYEPEGVVSSGLTRQQRDLEAAPGILMLEAYVRKATNAWVGTKGDSLPAIKQVAKIAAIAVRILERAGESDRLLTEGLR